jgi:hypothetical protein
VELIEAVADVKVLLEMMTQWKVEERTAVRGKLHRRGQATLYNREIARGQVAIELVDGDGRGLCSGLATPNDPRARDDDHAGGDPALASGNAAMTLEERS